MDSSKLSVKFYLDSATRLKLADVVPVFHSWIQLHLIPDHLLIDVADYAHVIDGPGVVLVSHEANFYLDEFDGRQGLTYTRKTPLEGSFSDRLATVFGAAIQACALLETNATLNGIRFLTDQVSFKINDRYFAPNTPETFTSIRPELEAFARELFGSAVTLEHRGNAKQLFEVQIKSATPVDLPTLAERAAEKSSAEKSSAEKSAAHH